MKGTSIKMDNMENINEEELNAEEAAEGAGAESTEESAAEEKCGKCDKKEKKCADKEQKKQKSRISQLENELKEAKAAAEEANDKYLRVCAEYDNFRKRSKAERDAVYADAAADSLKELLPLIDNLERATQYTAPDKVAEGVQMILSTLPAVFEKMQVRAFGEAGETFDPNIHNAVMHVEDEEHGEGEITDVFQKGYMIGDRVVRYAMVKVAN